MALMETITDEYHFWGWIKHSDSYSNNFTLQGAKALQAWFEELSEETGKDIEFDPITWCVEFSEYDSLADAWNELGNGTGVIEGEELAIDDNIQLWLENNTTMMMLDNHGVIVIMLDNGGVIVGEF